MLGLISCGKKGNPSPLGLAVPGTIADLAGEVKDGVLFLSFTIPSKNQDGSDMTDLDGFKVMRSCSSCANIFEDFKDIRLDEEKGYTIYRNRLYIFDDQLLPGFEYGYRVYPYTKNGSRGSVSNTYVVKWDSPPVSPRDVNVKVSDGMIEFRWPVENGFSYNLYRFDDGQYPLFPLNEKPLATGYYLDTGLTNGKQYRYELRTVQVSNGVRREGEGFRIDAMPVDNIPPPPPRVVRVERKGPAVRITWEQEAVEDILGFNIYRIVAGKKEKLNDELVKEEIFLDRSVPKVRYISYVVTSLDMSRNESDPSTETVILLKNE